MNRESALGESFISKVSLKLFWFSIIISLGGLQIGIYNEVIRMHIIFLNILNKILSLIKLF